MSFVATASALATLPDFFYWFANLPLFSGKYLLKIHKVYANPRGWQLKKLRTPSGKYLFFTKSTRVLRKIRNFFKMKNLAWSKQILRKINPKLMQITQIYAKNVCVRTPKYWVVNPSRLQTTLRFFGYFWPPPTCHDPSHLLSKSDSHVNCLSPEKVLNIAENRIVIYTYKSQHLCIYVYPIISKTIIEETYNKHKLHYIENLPE